jgi:hypothetical protein
MATIDPVITPVEGTRHARGIMKIQWVGKTDDTFVEADCADFADRSVQIAGTFAGGTSVSVLGSNDGTNYVALRNALTGNAITKTAAALEVIAELTAFVKPSVLSGSADEITITIIARKAA